MKTMNLKMLAVAGLTVLLIAGGCCTKSGGESQNRSPRPWGGGPTKGSLPGSMNEGR